MTQLVFWDQYGRELPGLISVSLHISVGIHAEEVLTHFLQILPTSVHNSGWLCCQLYTGRSMALSGWHVLGSEKICLSAEIGSTEPHRSGIWSSRYLWLPLKRSIITTLYSVIFSNKSALRFHFRLKHYMDNTCTSSLLLYSVTRQKT